MYTEAELKAIYQRSGGRCHLCHRKVYLTNYNRPGRRGAWEVEHSVARANGGTDRLSNLRPAHISCNREKGTMTTRAVRARNGRTRAPLTTKARKASRTEKTVAGGVIGALVGALAGPPGAVVGGALGAWIGHESDPEK